MLSALVIAVAPRPCVGLTDTYLCMPLPRSWSHSVAFGVTGGRCAAWIWAGDYRLRRRAHDEGIPDVPPRRTLITIGDFPRIYNGWNSKRVARLQLPPTKLAWRVIFHNRELFIDVRFGSKPDERMRRVADARLRSVRGMPGPDRCVPH